MGCGAWERKTSRISVEEHAGNNKTSSASEKMTILSEGSVSRYSRSIRTLPPKPAQDVRSPSTVKAMLAIPAVWASLLRFLEHPVEYVIHSSLWMDVCMWVMDEVVKQTDEVEMVGDGFTCTHQESVRNYQIKTRSPAVVVMMLNMNKWQGIVSH